MDIALTTQSSIEYSVLTSANFTSDQLVAVRLKSFVITGLISQQIKPVPPPAPGAAASARGSNNAPNLRNVPSDLDSLNGSIVLSMAGLASKPQTSTISWATDGNGSLKGVEKFAGYLVFLGQVNEFLDINLYVINSKASDRANLNTAKSVISSLAGIAGLVPGPGTLASAGLGLLSAIVGAVTNSATDSYELYYEGTRALSTGAPFQPIGGFHIARVPKNKPDLQLTFEVIPFPPLPAGDANKLFTVYLESIDLNSVSDIATQVVFNASIGSGASQHTFSLTLNLNQGRLAPSTYIALDNKFLYQGPKAFGVPYAIDIAINMTAEDASAEVGPLTDSINTLAKAATLPKDTVADIGQATKALQTASSLAMAFMPNSKQVASASGLILTPDQYAALPGGPTGFVSTVPNPNNKLEGLATIPLKSDNGASGNLVLRIVESDAPPKPTVK